MPYASADRKYGRRQFGNERNEMSGRTMEGVIGVWQGVAMDSLKLHLGPPHPTPLCPLGRSPLKRSLDRFRGGMPAGLAAFDRLLPYWTPHAICYIFISVAAATLKTKQKNV
jgi:hypothetical protein